MIQNAITSSMMEKVSQQVTDLSSLKKTLIVLKFMSPSYRKQVDLCCEYRLRENIRL